MEMAKSVLEQFRLVRFWIGGSTSVKGEASGIFFGSVLNGAEN